MINKRFYRSGGSPFIRLEIGVTGSTTEGTEIFYASDD